MLNLVQNFGLIIGDLIPHENPVWKIYIKLLQIIDICMSPVILPEYSILLSTLISEHHTLYIEVFKENLKPKYHFLIHYPNMMLKMGPLVNLWSMRFEAKHKELKSTAKLSCSRKILS